MNIAGLTPQTLIAGITELVTLPEVSLRVARMANDPSATAIEIGREISRDVALTARVLRVANSAALSRGAKIDTVTRAITLIGLHQVRNLAVGLGAVRSFERLDNDLVTMESFWRHSVLCAIAAQHVSRRCGSNKAQEAAFVAGLLHDIGELILYIRIPDLAGQALRLSLDAPDDREPYVFERSLMGFDHGIVGAEFARSWSLPRVLQECIEFHHEPHRAQEHARDAAVVHIADRVALLADIGSLDAQDAPPIEAFARDELNITREALSELVEQTSESAPELLAQLGGGAHPLPRSAAPRIL